MQRAETSESANVAVAAKVTASERAALRVAAQQLGRTPSSLIRDAVRAYLESPPQERAS